jgi:hypothetical protein
MRVQESTIFLLNLARMHKIGPIARLFALKLGQKVDSGKIEDPKRACSANMAKLRSISANGFEQAIGCSETRLSEGKTGAETSGSKPVISASRQVSMKPVVMMHVRFASRRLAAKS